MAASFYNTSPQGDRTPHLLAESATALLLARLVKVALHMVVPILVEVGIGDHPIAFGRHIGFSIKKTSTRAIIVQTTISGR